MNIATPNIPLFIDQSLLEGYFLLYFFPRVIFYFFLLIYGGLGFGVGAFSWWGLGSVVWSHLGLFWVGALYKHKRINLGKKLCLPFTKCTHKPLHLIPHWWLDVQNRHNSNSSELDVGQWWYVGSEDVILAHMTNKFIDGMSNLYYIYVEFML
mgnify:CR=1 FL=1